MRAEDDRRLLSIAAELADVATIHDVDYVLRDHATMLVRATRVRLWMVDGGHARLVDRHHERAIPLGETTNLIVQVLASRRAQWSSQCIMSDNVAELRAACIVPLIHEETVVGALAFAFPTERYFAMAERDLFLRLAERVAAAVARVRSMRWPKASSRIEVLAQPREVLIVDDDAYDAASLRDLVEAMQFEPLVAYNADAALRIAAQTIAPIAFISLGLSTGDGLDVANRLRAMPEWSSTRFIALAHNERARSRGKAAFDDALVKPLDAEAVRGQLQNTNG